jgi:adenosine kinase
LTKKFEVKAVVTDANKVVILKNGAEITSVVQELTSKERVISTVGAGDSFIGGFLSEFSKNKDLNACLINGMVLASISIEGVGVEHLMYRKQQVVSKKVSLRNLNTVAYQKD